MTDCTIANIAVRYRVHHHTVFYWITRGKKCPKGNRVYLKAFRLDRQCGPWRSTWADVQAFINAMNGHTRRR